MKISKNEITKIKKRLKNGETYSSVALSYGVKAWTIQKRIGGVHPYSGQNRNGCKFWEIIPNYVDCIKILCNKYGRNSYFFDEYFDILHDFVMNFSKKNVEYFKKCAKNGYGEAALIWHLKKVLFYNIKKNKIFKNGKLLIDEKGRVNVPGYNWLITEDEYTVLGHTINDIDEEAEPDYYNFYNVLIYFFINFFSQKIN